MPQRAIREHVNSILGRKCTDTPPEPAPKEDINRFKSTHDAEDGPSLGRFQMDFSENNPENSAWNCQLRDVFVEDYAKKGLFFTELKKVPVFFMAYLGTLQDAHRKMTGTGKQKRAYKKAAQRNRIEKRKKTVSPSAHPNMSTVTLLM